MGGGGSNLKSFIKWNLSPLKATNEAFYYYKHYYYYVLCFMFYVVCVREFFFVNILSSRFFSSPKFGVMNKKIIILIFHFVGGVGCKGFFGEYCVWNSLEDFNKQHTKKSNPMS